MAEPGLEWDDLRTFLMIARHRTLSAAARALNVHQPTMGRRLEALERRAGAKLLLKTPSGYVLTPAGEAVLGNVERIEMEARSIERLVSGADIRLEGVVQLTTVETLAAEILAPVFASFRVEHPAVRVEVVAATRALSLTRREADVALRLAPFTQPDLVARKVGEAGFGLYAAPSYLQRHGDVGRGSTGEGHFVIVTEPDLRDVAEMRWQSAALPDAKEALTTNSRLIHRAAAGEGIGIACLARYLGDAAPGLIRLDPPIHAGPPPVRDLWLGVHEDMRHAPRIRAFTDAIRDGLARAKARLNPD